MDELFADLPPLADCDEDCLLKLSSKNKRSIILQATPVDFLIEIRPGYAPEIDENPRLTQKRLEERSCMTDGSHLEQSDKWVQTDEVEVESKGCYAELPPTYRPEDYDESALERILRHISAYIHKQQVGQFTELTLSVSFSR
ncbi:unnamed protein product [Caenorhabditis bovis]|uniref:Uncharacterized protein n=1 Tax=Caenorhabditis bovis TaxID=2654633 RepID=A0A8S1FFC6_9PELO|nr:unnamed protein product [Caenorhabditis bovis]